MEGEMARETVALDLSSVVVLEYLTEEMSLQLMVMVMKDVLHLLLLLCGLLILKWPTCEFSCHF